MVEFKLSASLQAHEDDVRGVAFPNSESVLTASRDGSVRHWKIKSSTPRAFDDTVSVHGSSFVNAVTFAAPSQEYPNGLIISGGKDAIIDVRQPLQPVDSAAERLLLGHEGNICALDYFNDPKKPYLVSGSWDCSARIWDLSKGESTALLDGHGASCWAVLAYDAATVITGSADQQVRIFSTSGQLKKTIKAGPDVVRALCRIGGDDSPAQFASAGNDAIIRLWTLQGVEVAQLQGHENFIYSLAALPSGELVSSSEDRTVRIWKDMHCVQTITHPAISVWSVAVCAENGDIVSGASDRIARVFTRDTSRGADATTVAAFEDAVRSSAIPKQQMGDINKEKLPGPEFLTQKSGTKEGQVQMIRQSNGNITAHQWSTAANQWLEVGTVVDAAGSSGRKHEYQGQDYDYVFDVDIEDGKPALKLPYNLSSNPYETAQKFIADNELPITYLDQVANFIVTNTQGAGTIGQDSSTSSNTAASDPWGTGARYRPGDDQQIQSSPAPRPKVIPQKDYLTIAAASFPLMRKKIEELNAKLLADGRKDAAFSPGDLQSLPSLIAALESAPPSSSTSPPSPALARGIPLALKILTTWPPETRLPGLDLLRCLAAHDPTFASHLDPVAVLRDASAFEPSANVNTTMLAVRLLANLFAHPAGRAYALDRFSDVRALVAPLLRDVGGVTRNLLIAGATVYINYAVAFAQMQGGQDGRTEEAAALLVQDLAALLGDGRVVDSEVVYRGLVALGTSLTVSAAVAPREEKEKEGRRALLEKVAAAAKEPRIKGVIGEISQLL